MEFNSSKTIDNVLNNLNQHPKLKLRVGSHKNSSFQKGVKEYFFNPHRQKKYFFLFVLKGRSTHTIDLQEITVSSGQMLFVLPYQIHVIPSSIENIEFFKITFDESCLAMLPHQFSFLLDPRNNQLINLNENAVERILKIFELLESLTLKQEDEDQLLLSNLNTLLTEFQIAYFKYRTLNSLPDSYDLKYIKFKIYIEKYLTEHPSISTICRHLGLSANGLYVLVNRQIGCSPKAYITGRLILEAQRRLFYTTISIKELAYSLGFNDPDYFSKLFKKRTGRSVSSFINESRQITGTLVK